MIKRTVDVSEKAYIHIRHGQLQIRKQEELVAEIPVEDLGVLILQHPAIVITQAAIVACQKNNVAVIFCDEKHLPYSVTFPISDGHSLHTKILQRQIPVSETTKKQIWRQIVRHKISQQLDTLKRLGSDSQRLERMISQVRPGDLGNHEAQAAQVYWKLLLGEKFRRNQEEDGVNALLNYGYSIVRAVLARALVGGGLHPSLGIHHRNQYNGLCLADDAMEPFRPWVDFLVWKIAQQDPSPEICRESKQTLLELIASRVTWREKSFPMMVAVQYFVANLKSVMFGEEKELEIPTRT